VILVRWLFLPPHACPISVPGRLWRRRWNHVSPVLL
jgi:hypothetical protein